MSEPTDGTMHREAEHDIAAVLVRYATGIDRRDWEQFRTCFTADCEADYGDDIGVFHGADALTAFMTAAHAEMGHTLHRITNPAISVDRSGDAATARSYVDAVLMAPDGQSGVHPVGFYDDELVRTPDGWRITRRRFTMVRFELLGPT